MACVLQLLQAAPEGQIHRVALQSQVLSGVPQDAVNELPQVAGGQALTLGADQVFLCEFGPCLGCGGAAGRKRPVGALPTVPVPTTPTPCPRRSA